MPARDRYHAAVRKALEKDGWTITHDPFTLSVGRRAVFVDIGAERVLAAEKSGDKIAVEVKVFAGASDLRDLENAVGQYIVYDYALRELEPDRNLFLAVPLEAFEGILSEEIAAGVIAGARIAVLVFDPREEVIVRWTI